MENPYSKFLSLKESTVILIHGKKNVGKTAFVKKSLGGIDYVYFEFTENISSIEVILNVLKINLTNSKVNPDAMILQKLDQMINLSKTITIFDNIEKMDKDGLSIFFNLSMKALHNMYRGNIIGIYNDSHLKNDLKGMLTLLTNQGAFDMKMKKPTYEEFRYFIRDTGYVIPESIIKLIYDNVNGNYSLAEESLNELEKIGYVVEKTFIKKVDSPELENIRKLIVNIASKKFKIPKLKENEKILLFILENVNSIKERDIKKIMGIKNLDEMLDKLIKFKIISKNRNRIIIKKRIPLIIENANEVYSNIAKWYENKMIFEDAGKFYYLSGNWKKAGKILCNKKNLKIGLQNAKFCYDISKKPKLADQLIKYYETNEMLDEMYDLSKKLYHAYPDKLIYMKSFANASFLLNDYKISKQLYKKILKISRRNSYKLDSLIGLAKIHYKNEDFKNALDLILQALKIAIKTENRLKEAEIYKIIGNIYYYNYNDVSAKSYYEKSLQIYDELNVEKEKANIYNNLGNIYSETDIKKSLEYYSKALDLSEKNWWIFLIIALNINQGILSIYLGNLSNAIYNERRSVGLALTKKDYSSAILALVYIFEIQMLSGNYDEAEEIMKLCLKISKTSSAKISYKTFKMDKIILNILKGQLDEKEFYENTFPADIPIHSELAKYYASQLKFYKGDINGYIEEFRKNFIKKDQTIKIGDLLDLMNYMEIILYRDYFNKGDFKEILDLMKKIKSIKDLDNLKLIKWRVNIIDAILSLTEKNTRIAFYENIKKLENEGLRYLSAKLKLIYGLYYYGKTNDNSILEEGVKEFKSLNRPGLLYIYNNAVKMIS